MKRGRKKGISPVIATVLLIAMVVVVALIVFVWFRGMVGESATKMGKNIKLVCDDVKFDASYSTSSDKLTIVNRADVPIFQLRVRLSGGGSYGTEEITSETHDGSPSDEGKWELMGLTQEGRFVGKFDVDSAEKITVFPVLIGSSEDGRRTYVCEGQYGEEIDLSL